MIYMISYPDVKSGTYKREVRCFKRKGLKFYFWLLVMNIKYENVEVVDE